MRKVLRLKVSAVDIYASKAHGLGHSVLFTEIMKDTKLHTLSHSLAIILVVMVAVGNIILFLLIAFVPIINPALQFIANVISCRPRIIDYWKPCILSDLTIMLHICHRDKDGYHWLTGRVDDVINVRYLFLIRNKPKVTSTKKAQSNFCLVCIFSYF